MTITIDVWTLIPCALAVLFIGGGIYERGQRKGLEEAEELYEPLIKALESRIKGEDEQ